MSSSLRRVKFTRFSKTRRIDRPRFCLAREYLNLRNYFESRERNI